MKRKTYGTKLEQREARQNKKEEKTIEKQIIEDQEVLRIMRIKCVKRGKGNRRLN